MDLHVIDGREEHGNRHYSNPEEGCWDCMAESWVTPEAYQQAAFGTRYKRDLDIDVSARRIEEWRDRLAANPCFDTLEAEYIARDLGYGDEWPAVAATHYFPEEVKPARP